MLGKLRERVTFSRRSENSDGDRLGDWVAEFSCFARFSFMKGSEPAMMQRMQGVQPAMVTVHRTTRVENVDTDWRIVFNNKSYNIQAIVPNERRSYIDFLVKRDQSDD